MNFVETCLEPHLRQHQVWVTPSLIRAPSGRHRGGRVNVKRLVDHIVHEYDSTDRISTLVDFYGFQDRNERSREELEQAIRDELSERLGKKYDPRFILPYVQMHEFEGLLFTDVDKFHWVMDAWDESKRQALLTIRNSFNNPEEINCSSQTAPSKRLEAIFGAAYSKTEHGPLIAEDIGLPAIRAQCPQFDAWVSKLEAWGNESDR
ncbi:MAG: DUF4276 family protein [Burkholderiales bacterium]|nr:DUF4276 family protein [Burkholderiales bacterium]